MNRALTLIAAPALLSGCLSYTPMYKVGATVQESNVARAQCNTYAAQTVPPMIIEDWWPVRDGQGRVIGHRYEVFDANEGRRNATVRSCLEQQGFERVSIPMCKTEQIDGRSFRPLTVSPPITPGICAIRQTDGSRVLIDLSKPAG